MEDLQKDFVPYELALRMKEIEFRERVLTYYEDKIPKLHSHILGWDFNTSFLTCVSRPTFSQAFRFFREIHNIHGLIEVDWDKTVGVTGYLVTIVTKDVYSDGDTNIFKTQEEAELACLEKLLEIVEENGKDKSET